MELAAFLLAEQRASLLRAEHKVNDDIGKDWDIGVKPLQG